MWESVQLQGLGYVTIVSQESGDQGMPFSLSTVEEEILHTSLLFSIWIIGSFVIVVMMILLCFVILVLALELINTQKNVK